MDRFHFRQVLDAWKMNAGETVKEYYDLFFKTLVHCPYNFDEEDAIRVYWNGLSDFEKQQGAYRTYEPAPGITYDEFMRDI